MNPNQNPHHNYPGGLPPGQNPNYPGGVNPNFPPQGMPPFGNYPMYQAGVPHPFGQMPQPQYPGGPRGADPRIPPDFMNVRTSSVKPEPSWGDAGYGVGPSGSAGNVQGPPQGFGMAGGYPPGFGTRGMPIDLSGDTRPGMPGHYAPPPPQQQPGPSTSILAQHLSSAPLPPPQPPQQPSHLSQLLQQQPAYPGVMGGAMGGAMHQAPGGGMVTASGRQVPNNSYEFEALQLTNIQNRQLMAAQAAYLEQQQHFQQQQATRAAQLQAEQAAAQAAVAQQHAAAAQQAPPTLHLAPPTQGFPPSASSAHSANSAMRQEATSLFANQLTIPRESPRHKETDLNKLTTGELCQYGRDLVNELNYKTSSLSLLLKRVMDRRPPADGENPAEVAARCRQNLERMVQIRVIIEKRRPPEWKRLTGDDYIEMMLDDSELEKPMDEKRKEKRAELERKYPGIMSATQPNDGDVFYQGRWIPEALHQKYMKFEANKILLMNLASDLKNLAWKIDVTSPGHLKRVDQTKISKKREDGGNP
ncbi:hypothetical protein L5515_005523 [Caenorhabditis briggsae]|uniref:Protein CBR-MDT-30 n=1 Tax=Caenorhabditis briggsae TaxID=6238 RepID=A0AAE9ET02_CAEBR|nr:hypothetical protein L5515_005523 [Caenorhabditis briggsae]